MDRKIRVMTVVDGASGLAGAEKMAVMVATHLDGSEFDRVFCATRGDLAPKVLNELDEAGVEIVRLRRPWRFALWAWWPLISLIRRQPVDVIHAHKFGSNAWATIIGRLCRVPVVIAHEHSWDYQGQRFRMLIDRELIGRGATLFLAVSEEDRRRMIDVEGIDSCKVRLMPNGIPQQRLGKRASVRTELGIAADAPVIGSVGGLRPPKAYGVLIQATARLVDEFPRLRTLIVGRGPEEGSLRALIADAGLEDHVSLLGARHDVPDVLAALDVAVCSSISEG